MAQLIARAYFDELHRLSSAAEVSDGAGQGLAAADGFAWVIDAARSATQAGGKLIFIGNGGSAGIASHLAVDYAKNGRLRAMACNDGAVLTCLGNDYGYEQVFAKQLEWHARPGDILVAISSSGRSANILNAVHQARLSGCQVVTFSGFAENNPLRALGDMNFYVASSQYGLVEISHLTLCHAILDFSCDWRAALESDRS